MYKNAYYFKNSGENYLKHHILFQNLAKWLAKPKVSAILGNKSQSQNMSLKTKNNF